MDVLTKPTPTWDDTFRQIIITNCRYWLNRAQTDVTLVVPETAQMLQALTYALTLPAAWATARDLVRTISPTLIRQGRGVTWEAYLVKSIARSREEGDPAEIDFRLELGNLCRLQGRLAEARTFLQAALDLCEQYNRQDQYWTIINTLALVARLSGQSDEALAYCQQVLDKKNLPAKDRAEALNVMGLVAFDRLQETDALAYFDQALALYRTLDDPYQMARLLTNRGAVLQESNRLSEARQSYEKAIQQFQLSDDESEIFKPIMNLGNVFLLDHDYEIARHYYEKVLPIFRDSGYSVDLGHVYNNLGLVYVGLEDWETAESYYFASLEVWKTLGDNYNLAKIRNLLGKMYFKARQLEKAYTSWEQALIVLENTSNSPAKAQLQQFIKDQLANRNDVSDQKIQ